MADSPTIISPANDAASAAWYSANVGNLLGNQAVTAAQAAQMNSNYNAGGPGITAQQDAAMQAQKYAVAMSVPRNDLAIAPSQNFLDIQNQYNTQHYATVGSSPTQYNPQYQNTQYITNPTNAAQIAYNVALSGGTIGESLKAKAEPELGMDLGFMTQRAVIGQAPATENTVYQKGVAINYETPGALIYGGNAKDFGNIISTPIKDQSQSTPSFVPASESSILGATVTTNVPWGHFVQEVLPNSKVALGKDTGEIAIYLPQYDDRGNLMGYGLSSSGGRNAAQSGMFTIGKAETPYTVSREGVSTFIRPTGEGMSRLGSEPYGGTVMALDNRTIEGMNAANPGSVQMSKYANIDNLANYVNPQGPNMSKAAAPGANVPWAIGPSSPALQYMNENGIIPGSGFNPAGAIINTGTNAGAAASAAAGTTLPTPFMSTISTAPSQAVAAMATGKDFYIPTLSPTFGFGAQGAGTGVNNVISTASVPGVSFTGQISKVTAPTTSMATAAAVAGFTSPEIRASNVVLRPSDFDLMVLNSPLGTTPVAGTLIGLSDSSLSGTNPLAGLAKGAADAAKTMGLGNGGEALFGRYNIITETGAPVNLPTSTTIGAPVSIFKDLGNGAYSVTTTTPTTTSGGTVTPTTTKYVPLEGGMEGLNKYVTNEFTGKIIPELSYKDTGNVPLNYLEAGGIGITQGLRNKPVDTVLNLAIGAGLAASGEWMAGLGAGAVSGTAAGVEAGTISPYIGTIARGTNWFVNDVAPVALVGLYGASVAQRTTEGKLTYSGDLSNVGSYRLSGDLSPAAAQRFGTIGATELGPMLAGGIAWSGRSAISEGARNTFGNLRDTAVNLARAADTSMGMRMENDVGTLMPGRPYGKYIPSDNPIMPATGGEAFGRGGKEPIGLLDLGAGVDQSWRYDIKSKPSAPGDAGYVILGSTRVPISEFKVAPDIPVNLRPTEDVNPLHTVLRSSDFDPATRIRATDFSMAKDMREIETTKSFSLDNFLQDMNRYNQPASAKTTLMREAQAAAWKEPIRTVTGEVPPDFLPGVGRIGGLEQMAMPNPFAGLADEMGLSLEPAGSPKGIGTSTDRGLVIKGASMSQQMLEHVTTKGAIKTGNDYMADIDAMVNQKATAARVKPAVEAATMNRIVPSKTSFERAQVDLTGFNDVLKNVLESQKRAPVAEAKAKPVHSENLGVSVVESTRAKESTANLGRVMNDMMGRQQKEQPASRQRTRPVVSEEEIVRPITISSRRTAERSVAESRGQSMMDMVMPSTKVAQRSSSRQTVSTSMMTNVISDTRVDMSNMVGLKDVSVSKSAQDSLRNLARAQTGRQESLSDTRLIQDIISMPDVRSKGKQDLISWGETTPSIKQTVRDETKTTNDRTGKSDTWTWGDTGVKIGGGGGGIPGGLPSLGGGGGPTGSGGKMLDKFTEYLQVKTPRQILAAGFFNKITPRKVNKGKGR